MTENLERVIEHDRLFKELISTFFWEFLELFFPDLIPYIDQSSITFLPQEVFIDITSGNRREVDLLAKVRFREQESFFPHPYRNSILRSSGFCPADVPLFC